MQTVDVKVFVGKQRHPRGFELDWRERTDMAFKVRGDCPSARRKQAAKILKGRSYQDFRLVGTATAGDGSGNVYLYLRPAEEMAHMAKEPGWVPVTAPRQRPRHKRER